MSYAHTFSTTQNDYGIDCFSIISIGGSEVHRCQMLFPPETPYEIIEETCANSCHVYEKNLIFSASEEEKERLRIEKLTNFGLTFEDPSQNMEIATTPEELEALNLSRLEANFSDVNVDSNQQIEVEVTNGFGANYDGNMILYINKDTPLEQLIRYEEILSFSPEQVNTLETKISDSEV